MGSQLNGAVLLGQQESTKFSAEESNLNKLGIQCMQIRTLWQTIGFIVSDLYKNEVITREEARTLLGVDKLLALQGELEVAITEFDAKQPQT